MILVSVLILVVCQAFSNIASISESQLPASMCCSLVQNIKQEKENNTTHHTHTHTYTHRRTNETKEQKHDIQARKIPCVATISKHQPSANRPTTVYMSGLSLESQQKMSSFKLLCCHHSNHFLSRTLGLCSSPLGKILLNTSIIRECKHLLSHTHTHA